MRGLKLEIEKDIKNEKQILKRYKLELARLPKGSLSHYKKNGKTYYKHITYMKGKDGTSTRLARHLRKEEEATILALQRKAYLRETVRRIEKNLRLEIRMAAEYEAYDFYSVMEALGEAYRTDSMENFLKQEGIKTGPADLKGRAYRAEGLTQNTSGGFRVRSKGEMLISESMLSRHIIFYYEMELKVTLPDGRVVVLHPDFAIPIRGGGYILWEHAGLLSRPDYAVNLGEKLHLYNLAGYSPGINLIITADDKDGNTDMKSISQILDWLETVCMHRE